MAGPGNQHCANCIGTLSFPRKTSEGRNVVSKKVNTSACAQGLWMSRSMLVIVKFYLRYCATESAVCHAISKLR